MHRPSRISLVIAGCAAVVTSPFAFSSDAWQYEVTPYVLGAGMSGTVGVHGMTAEVDASFDDIIENLDAGFMGVMTAQRGRWTFGLEGVYMKLEGESQVARSNGGAVSLNGTLDWSNSLNIYQASAGYRVRDEKTKVDVIGAIRYMELDLGVAVTQQFTPGIIFAGGTASADGAESWTDVAAGVRVEHPVSEHVSLMGYADVGAGGSDLSWQMIAGINWAYAEHFSAKLGYRVLEWDYADDGTIWDMSASGPYAGLGIRF